MKKLPWLDRSLMLSAYYYCLRVSEHDFHEELTRLEVPPQSWPKFVSDHSDATVHYFESSDGKLIAIVCLDLQCTKTKSGIQIASLLVHEAVHIWQQHARLIGSRNDRSDEEEAHAIQFIAQNLMESFSQQVVRNE